MDVAVTDFVATLAAVVVTALSLFQFLLAIGLPLGRAAFGGGDRVLPKRLRLMSAISSLVFVAALFIILERGGLFGTAGRSVTWARVGLGILAAMFGLSTLANVASRSAWERRLMAPVALLLTVCCVTLAL
jgi:hypothetical protein